MDRQSQLECEDILARMDFTIEDLTWIVDGNPSLRGMLLGYLAELKLRKIWFERSSIVDVSKSDDHDRIHKGDLVFSYKGQKIIVEVKSLQTNSIKKDGAIFRGKAQVDASDRRDVLLDDNNTVNTTCLRVGEFDILAVNIFAFEDKWRYIFARNKDLPRSGFKKYTQAQQQQLLATLVPVSWPPEPPFVEDPYPLIEEIIQERIRCPVLPVGGLTNIKK